MKIFLSWSIVEPTGQFAKALHDWLSTTFSHIETWISLDPTCLPKGLVGSGFAEKVFENILSADACIIIITKESLNRPWLYYEAGAFQAQRKHIVTILCEGVEHSDFTDSPLVASGMNYSKFSENDMIDILTSLHFNQDTKSYLAGFSKERITTMVKRSFAELETAYHNIFDDKYQRKHHIRKYDSDV
jgi:hypothetical protein